MPEVRLSAEPRTEFGKGGARRTRRAGKIPAVIYGHGADPRHVSIPAREFAQALKHGGMNVLLTAGRRWRRSARHPEGDPAPPDQGHLRACRPARRTPWREGHHRCPAADRRRDRARRPARAGEHDRQHRGGSDEPAHRYRGEHRGTRDRLAHHGRRIWRCRLGATLAGDPDQVSAAHPGGSDGRGARGRGSRSGQRAGHRRGRSRRPRGRLAAPSETPPAAEE